VAHSAEQLTSTVAAAVQVPADASTWSGSARRTLPQSHGPELSFDWSPRDRILSDKVAAARQTQHWYAGGPWPLQTGRSRFDASAKSSTTGLWSPEREVRPVSVSAELGASRRMCHWRNGKRTLLLRLARPCVLSGRRIDSCRIDEAQRQIVGLPALLHGPASSLASLLRAVRLDAAYCGQSANKAWSAGLGPEVVCSPLPSSGCVRCHAAGAP
jgi:hypothetical protein